MRRKSADLFYKQKSPKRAFTYGISVEDEDRAKLLGQSSVITQATYTYWNSLIRETVNSGKLNMAQVNVPSESKLGIL